MLRKVYSKALIVFTVLILLLSSCEAPTDSPSSSSSSYTSDGCATVQCSAKTKDGTRCLRKTTNCNGRCWQHQ